MFERIVLICGETEFPYLVADFTRRDPSLVVERIDDQAGLERLAGGDLAGTRLVGFCASLVVPAAILDRVGYGAFNIHPGPPEYPGWMPSAFALYQGTRRFGATGHAMIEKVDAGPIFVVERFDVAPGTTREALDTEAFGAAVRVFRFMVDRLVRPDPAFLPIGITWGPRKSTRRAYAEACRITPDMPADEVDRRVAAFGDGDGFSRPHILLHGHRFELPAPQRT